MKAKPIYVHLVIIVITALVISLSFGLLLYAKKPLLCRDIDQFGKLGVTWAQTGTFGGSVRRAPVYPLVLGITYRLFGIENHYALICVQSLFPAILGLLVYCASFHFFKSQKIAFFSAILCILCPMVWWYVPRIWLELIFSIATFLTVYRAWVAITKPTLKNLAVFGFVTGISALCKAIIVLLPLFLAIGMWIIFKIRHMHFSGFYKILVIPTLCMLITIFPWSLRNKLVSGKWILVSSNLSNEFYRGNVFLEYKTYLLQHDSDKIWETINARESEIRHNSPIVKDPQSPTEVEIDRIFNPMMKDFIIHHPDQFVWKIVRGLLAFWICGETKMKSYAFIVGSLFSLGIFAGGFIMYRKESMAGYIVLLTIIYFSFLYAAIIASARYSIPLYPLMLTIGAPFLYRLLGFKP